MREETLTGYLNIGLIIICLLIVLVHAFIYRIKKNIRTAKSIKDIRNIDCNSSQSYIAFTGIFHKIMTVVLVVGLLLVATKVILITIGATSVRAGLFDIKFLLSLLICVGGYATSKAFLNLFLYFEKRCQELARGNE